MNDLRSKKRNLLLSHKIWNPCEENAKLCKFSKLK